MIEKPHSPACERNREPILALLREHFAERRHVLEIGSGTGQHAVHFAAAMPWLVWQCSDRREYLPGIRSWLDEAELANTPAPVELDVARGPWPAPALQQRQQPARFDAAYSANTLHIMSWREVEASFAGLAAALADDAKLAVYGPFNYGGAFTSDSNAAFDASLKARDPAMGIRDFEAVDALARAIGLRLVMDATMPANNRLLVWHRDGSPNPQAAVGSSMTMPLISGLTTPAHALVTGASSGIGLALVELLLARADVAQVFAVSRSVLDNAQLAVLQESHGERLRLLAADLTLDADLAALAARVREHTGTLHLVFNAAGLLHAPGLRPEKSVAQLRREALAQVFAVNAFAPILLAQALLPLMQHGQPAVLASLSARVGSIGDNRLGGWYGYRASKAAQNQLLRTLSIELRRTHPQVTCVLLHPGTVDTPLSKPFQLNVPAEKLFGVQRAAQQLLAAIASLTPARSGSFLAWDGATIPW